MHIYKYEGKEYPSVTTIIKLISNNDDLMNWANFMGFKRKNIKDILEKSSEFGSSVHLYLQKFLENEPLNYDEIENSINRHSVPKVIDEFKKFISDYNYETIFTEKVLISPTLGFAGTCDWLCKLDGLVTLVDFKTSKTYHDTMFLQLGGYNKLLLEKGIEIDRAMIINVSENGCKPHSISRKKLDDFSDAFCTLSEFYLKWAAMDKKPENHLFQKNK